MLAFFNLGRDIKKSSLQEWVEMFAPVQNVDIILDRFDVPKGFAFVTFNSIDDATSVMESLHNKVWLSTPFGDAEALATSFFIAPTRLHPFQQDCAQNGMPQLLEEQCILNYQIRELTDTFNSLSTLLP